MSIISDALRKAQEKRSNGTSDTLPPAPAHISEQAFPEKKDIERLTRKSLSISTIRIIILGVILAVIVPLVILVFFNSFSSTNTTPASTVQNTVKEKAPVPVSKQKPSLVITEAAVTEERTQKETLPVFEESVKLPALSGIMYSPTNPMAILNGEMLGEGSEIDGFTIQKILTNRVKLLLDGKEYEIKLR